MTDGLLESLADTLKRFRDAYPTEAACARYLSKRRWPCGFVCDCGGRRGYQLKTRPLTYQCGSCGRQTSITAGTALHGSRLPLKIWFGAAHIIATYPDMVTVREFQKLLGIPSYKTAWRLRQVLDRLNDNPDVYPLDDYVPPLAGRVEINSMMLSRFGEIFGIVAAGQSVGNFKISKDKKLHLDLIDGDPAKDIERFVRAHVARGTTLTTKSGFVNLHGYAFDDHTPLRYTDAILAEIKENLENEASSRPSVKRYLKYIVDRENRALDPVGALLAVAIQYPPQNT